MTELIAALAFGIAGTTAWLFAKSEKQYKKELFNYQLQIKTLENRTDRLSGDWLKLREEVMALVQEREIKNSNEMHKILSEAEEIKRNMVYEANDYLKAREYESQRESFIDEVVDRINRKQLNV